MAFLNGPGPGPGFSEARPGPDFGRTSKARPGPGPGFKARSYTIYYVMSNNTFYLLQLNKPL